MNRSSISAILLNSIDCIYIFLNKDLQVVSANANRTSFFYSFLPENGNVFLPYFSNPYHKKFALAFKAIEQGEQQVLVVNAPFNLDKNARDIKWNICAVYSDDNINGFELLGTFSNLTAPENMKRQTSNLHIAAKPLFDQEANPFCSYNLAGEIISVNDAFANLLQIEKAALINTPFISLIDANDLDAIKEYVSKANNGFAVNYNCSLTGKNDQKVSACIINTPLIESSILSGVNVFVSKAPHKLQANKDEKRLKLILSKVKKILNSSVDMICTFDETGKFTNISAACKEILGYEPKELIGKNYTDFVYEEDLQLTANETQNIKKGRETTNFENRFYKKDGSVAHLIWSSRWEEADKRFYSIARDAVEKKRSEMALKASEEKYKILFHNHPIPSWILDLENLVFLEVNNAAIKNYGYSRAEFLTMPITNIIADIEIERFNTEFLHTDLQSKGHKGLWLHKKKNNGLFLAETNSDIIHYNGKKAMLVLSIDRTEETLTEQQLRKSDDRYYFLSEATFDGIGDCNLLTNEIQWNSGARKIFGLTDSTHSPSLDWWQENMHDEDRERVNKKLRIHLEQGINQWEDEYRVKNIDNIYRYIYNRGYIFYGENKKPLRLIIAMQDLTERKGHENMLRNLNHALEKRASELAESNAELERFAYVTSHDLQEPLRMVTSFLQLLEKRYKDKLDNKANEYISYAVDGAERMKRLILDLLEYSRVNSSKTEVEDVDVEEVVADLKNLYNNVLQQTNGTIISKKLPVIKGSRTQILQLFQNIIGNALKYKSEEPPVISISCNEEILFYKFGITDNGIGINPKFFNKIFIIFQRLHNREEYSGTGIGLAICKKIVDKHGGNIWVTSAPGRGSTFYFTLPKSK